VSGCVNRGISDDAARDLRGRRQATPGGAAMNQVAHIFSKDLRRLRWSVVGWSALVGTRMLINTAGADIALGGFGPQLGIGELSALLSLMYVLLLALLISRLVHDEPLVGRDAFWITRPIAPAALMAAKLV